MREEHIALRKSLGTCGRIENEQKLFYEKNKFYGFKKITDERKKEIEEKATFWSLQNNEMSNNQKLFSILYLLNKKHQLEPLKIELHDESYLFLILAFDPSLKLMQIYYEASTNKEIKKRFEEEFCIPYDSKLLTIETYYNERFPTVVDEFRKKI